MASVGPWLTVRAEGTSYHGLMQFEPPEAEEMLGPLVLDTALSDIPLFGKDKADVASIIRETLESTAEPDQLTEDRDASHVPLPEAFAEATTIADKIIALLDYPKTTTLEHRHGSGSTQRSGSLGAGDGAKKMAALAIADSKHLSSHDRHEKLIESLQDTRGYPREAQAVLDHIMLLRAKEKYLFDYQHNSRLVKDNEWLSRMWDWICGEYLLV